MTLRHNLTIMATRFWAILTWSSLITGSTAIHTITVIVGDDVLIPCQIEGTTSHNADWWFKCWRPDCELEKVVDKGLIVNGRSIRFRLVNDSETTGSLFIAVARADDAGTYTCIGDGGYANRVVSQLAVFDVPIAPRMTFAVFSGDTISLPCHVDKAETAVDWWRQQKPGSSPEPICSSGFIVNGFAGRYTLDRSNPLEQNLAMHSIQANESGLYTCVAEGRRISVKVEVFETDVDDRLLSQSATVGTNAELMCTVKSSSVVSWWFEGFRGSGMQEISQLGYVFGSFVGKVQLKRNANQSAIVLLNVAPQDGGTYTCIEDYNVGDGVGRRTRVAFVVVQDAITANIAAISPQSSTAPTTGVMSLLYIFGATICTLLILVALILLLTVSMRLFAIHKGSRPRKITHTPHLNSEAERIGEQEELHAANECQASYHTDTNIATVHLSPNWPKLASATDNQDSQITAKVSTRIQQLKKNMTCSCCIYTSVSGDAMGVSVEQ